MKKIINKTTMAIILALAMVLALFSGLFFVKQANVADAAGKPVTVKIEALDKDTNETKKSFSKGSEFNVRVTRSSDEAGNFYAISMYIGVLNADKSGFDATKCNYLTFVPGGNGGAPISKSTNITNTKTKVFTDTSTAWAADKYATNGLLLISISNDKALTLSNTEDYTFTFGLKINNDVPDGTDFEIGASYADVPSSSYAYIPSGSSNAVTLKVKDTTKFEMETLSFTVKEPSNDNTLKSLKAGQGETASDLIDLTTALTTDPMTLTVDSLTKPLSVLLETNDENASVKVKPTNSDSADDVVVVENNTLGQITLPDDGLITIVVKAENGDEKEYKIQLDIVAAKLVNLTATTDSTQTGVTKNGLKETFDSATTAYTVYVPSDSTKVTLNAQVSTGHNESNTIALAKTGACTIPPSATSGTSFDVTDIADGNTVTLTLSAAKGGTNSSEEYVLTFEKLNVSTDIELTVTGSTTKRVFENSESKATANSVDYYYVVAGETNASSSVAITTDAAAVTLDGTAYTTAVTLTAGSHTISVEAEAGNTKQYTFVLKNYIAIQLKSNVEADFVFEETAGVMKYVRTYKEKSLVHGRDDLTYETLVIGQITDYTSVNGFLANFDTSKNYIKLYNQNGELVFNCGTATGSYTTADLDDTTMPVGTGWKLEYVVSGNVEETIYLSVLGDMDGDGAVNASDIAFASDIIQEKGTAWDKFNADVVTRLASYILNSGEKPAANEIAAIGYHIKSIKALSTNFYTA